MTSVALGLMFGLGLYLLWWSCWIEPPVDNRRERRAGPLTRLTDDIVQAGLRGLGARGLLAGCVAAGLLTFITAWALIAVVPIAVCFAVMVGCSPVIYVRRRARLRRSRLRDLWPDVVDNVTSGIRAGMSLPEALSAVAVRGPAELRPAFAAFSEDYRLTGRFNECLDRLKVSVDRVAANRARGRWVRPGSAAAHALPLPQRRRAGARGDRGTPILDSECRKAGGCCTLAGALVAIDAARIRSGLCDPDRRARPVGGGTGDGARVLAHASAGAASRG